MKRNWCGQEFVQGATNFPVNTMSNSGNPPDRGPGGPPVKNLLEKKLVATTLSSNSMPTNAMHLYSSSNSSSLATNNNSSGQVQVVSRMQNAVHSVLTSSRGGSSSVSTNSPLKSVVVGSNSCADQDSSSISSGDRWTVDSGLSSASSAVVSCSRNNSSSSSATTTTNTTNSNSNTVNNTTLINVSLASTTSCSQGSGISGTSGTSSAAAAASASGQAAINTSLHLKAQLFKTSEKKRSTEQNKINETRKQVIYPPKEISGNSAYTRWEDGKISSLSALTLEWTKSQVKKLTGRVNEDEDGDVALAWHGSSSSINTAASDNNTPGNSSLKRKASSGSGNYEAYGNEAKRQRFSEMADGLLSRDKANSSSSCSQPNLPCLLSPLVVTQNEMKKNKQRSQRDSKTNSSASADVQGLQTPATGSPELQNSLLKEFDPTKILSRFRSNSSRGRGGGSSLTTSLNKSNSSSNSSSNPSKTHVAASVMNKSFNAQDSAAARSVRSSSWISSKNRESVPVGPSCRFVYQHTKPSKNTRAWRRRLVKLTAVSIKLNLILRRMKLKEERQALSRLKACNYNFENLVTKDQSKVIRKKRRRRRRIIERKNKVDLKRSLRRNEVGTEVIYVDKDESVTITDTQIRLAAAVYARKAVQKSKRLIRRTCRKKVEVKKGRRVTNNNDGQVESNSRTNRTNKLNRLRKGPPSKATTPVVKSSHSKKRREASDKLLHLNGEDKSEETEEVVIISDSNKKEAVNNKKEAVNNKKEGEQRQIHWTESATIMTKIKENPLVDNAIELIRHKRDVQELIELMDEKGIVYGLSQMPKLQSSAKGAVALTQNNIPMTSSQTKVILQKRLPILLAHGGFTHVNLQPLCVLTDVLEEFYKKMALRLKQVTEMEMHGAEQDFPDALERTLVEFGMGGVRGLQDYYDDRIVEFRKRVEDQCTNVRSQYFEKLQSKIGLPRNKPSENASDSSSTPPVTSSPGSSSANTSQPVSPGNRTLLDMLTGLKTPTKPTSIDTREIERNNLEVLDPSPKPTSNDHQQEYQLQMTSQPSTPSSSSLSRSNSLSQKPSSPSLKSLLNSNSCSSNCISPGINYNHHQSSQRHRVPTMPPCPSPSSSSSSKSPISNPNFGGSKNRVPLQQYPKGSHNILRDRSTTNANSNINSGVTPGKGIRFDENRPSSSSSSMYQQSNSNMVSINLNNNVDLGINSNSSSSNSNSLSGNGTAPSLVNSSGGGGGGLMNSKAKLKEAISQKNLLRLNFEQIPSNCDSTVLLSSSSPSLSSSSGNNASSNKKPSSQTSINQTTQLKL